MEEAPGYLHSFILFKLLLQILSASNFTKNLVKAAENLTINLLLVALKLHEQNLKFYFD